MLMLLKWLTVRSRGFYSLMRGFVNAAAGLLAAKAVLEKAVFAKAENS